MKGDFALVHIKSRRPDSKGTEWLLIKHRDAYDQPGYDIDKYDYSVLTRRSLREIAGDEGSAAWKSSRKASIRGGSSKNDWLADSIAKADAKRAKAEKKSAGVKAAPVSAKSSAKPCDGQNFQRSKKKLRTQTKEEESLTPSAAGIGRKAPMPGAIHPMLATMVDKPFDDDAWLYEIKWDGYRAVVFLDGNSLRLVSRNQNDLTDAYPELHEIAGHIKASRAILDGEIVALDDEGRPSFSLMQQRTGVGEGGRRIRRTRDDIPVVVLRFRSAVPGWL